MAFSIINNFKYINMPISGKYFPTQTSGERIFLLVRRHWLVFAVIISLIVVLLSPVPLLVIYWIVNPTVFSSSVGNFIIVLGGIYLLAVYGLFLYGFINYYLDVYIVTNRRIVDISQNGFFRREISELHLHQVQDVEAKVDGFFQTIMHFGDVYIQTAGERENFIFEDVPHPYTLAKKIIELHEAQIESEYEPRFYGGEKEIDDYRPEDFYQSNNKKQSDEEIGLSEFTEGSTRNSGISENGTGFLDSNEQKTPNQSENVNNQSNEEISFDNLPEGQKNTESSNSRSSDDSGLNELPEGKEISLDDRDREI